jgi:hypothetical protein
MKRHAIITCCDAKYGDFLIHHWLQSLRTHVSLDEIDVVVIDYGLSPDQSEHLRAKGAILHPAKKDGSFTNIRHRDLTAFLQATSYDQVLSIDGGDIIFQADISPLFEQNKDVFRAGIERRFTGSMHESLLGIDDIRREFRKEISEFLWNLPAVNGGVIFGPAPKFGEFYAEMLRLCDELSHFATDQYLLSYFLHKTGFMPLDERYNFVLMTTRTSFTVRNGVFLGPDGSPIPVVHNSGQTDSIRVVRNFGFGPDRNQVRRLQRTYLQFSQSLIRVWNGIWGPKRTR